MLRQMHDGTQYSANIEKHAQPNTPDIFDPKSPDLLNDAWFHPSLTRLPKYSLEDGSDIIKILKFLVSIRRLKEDEHYYYTYPDKPGFPRILICFNTKHNLEDLENQFNTDQYNLYLQFKRKYRRKNREYSKVFFNYLHTLNNIPVSAVRDAFPDLHQPVKTLYERVVGDPNDYYDNTMAWAKSKTTLFAAAKRQVKSAPTPDPIIAEDFLKYAKQKVDAEVGPLLRDFGYSYRDWFNHLPNKKQTLIQPIYNYFNDPLRNEYLTGKQLHEMTTQQYEAICKTEIQPLDGKPRMVCSIPQIIKYTMGPVTWHLEQIFEENYNGYCGSMNLTQMAQKLNHYIDLGFTKVVEGDGSAFDNSQDITLKELDRYIYSQVFDKVYHVPKHLFKQIANLYYKGMSVKYAENDKKKTFFKYYVLGTVFSGDCDTTLANTIRMATYNCYVNEKSGLKYGVDFVVLSKGDDFSVLYKNYIPNSLIQSIYDTYFLHKPDKEYEMCDIRQYGIGQICKFLDIGAPDSFKFCSLRSWYIDEEHHITLTRDPQKLYSISQYSIKTKTYEKPQLIAYHHDLALSYRTNYPGIEIFELMAQAHDQKAEYICKYATERQKLKAKRIIEAKRNIQLDTIDPEISDDIFSAWYNVKHKHNIIKIQDNYWDTVSRIEKSRNDKLSDRSLKLVNQAINNEFNLDQLCAILALKAKR